MADEQKKTREFYLNESVTESSMGNLIKEIREINKHDDEQEKIVVNYEREPITLVISSFGGSAYDCLGLIAAMQMSKTPIHTECLSKAMSAGFFIFISGHKRRIHGLATLMCHTVRWSTMGDVQTMEEDTEEAKRLNDIVFNITANKTHILRSTLDDVRKNKRDWYIDGEEAVKLGCADELMS